MGPTTPRFVSTALGAMSSLMLLVTVPMIVLLAQLWLVRDASKSTGGMDVPETMAGVLASLSVPIVWSLLIFGVVIPLQMRRPAWIGTAILTGLVSLLGLARAYPDGRLDLVLDWNFNIENTNRNIVEDLAPLFETLKNGTDLMTRYRILWAINEPGSTESYVYSRSQVLGVLRDVMGVLHWILFSALIFVMLLNIGSSVVGRQNGYKPGALSITVAGRRFYLNWGREGEIALPTTSEAVGPAAPSA